MRAKILAPLAHVPTERAPAALARAGYQHLIPLRSADRVSRERAVLGLQRLVGNAEVGRLLDSTTTTPSAGTGAAASTGMARPATSATSGNLGLLDLIGGVGAAVGPAAARLLVAAGLCDETQLTNLLFWARHPDMAGKKISAGQKAFVRDWLEIRDQIVAPLLATSVKDKTVVAVESKEPVVPKGAGGGATAGSTGGKIRASTLGKYGEEEETEFRRRVYAEQMARAETRKEFHPGVAAEDLEELEDGRFMHKEAAGDGRALLAQARADLAAAQANGDKKSLSVKSIGVNSAYRSPQTDFSAWQRAFNTHYKRTQAEREKLPGGPLGDAAVAFLSRHLARYKAVPGFSNHTKGRAIDFSTREGKASLGASSSQNNRWMQSWLWHWLGANAGKFGFRPYKAEAWHWDHG